MRRLLERAQPGQAAVETAIVTPLMVFFILGILQITLMQQAGLMLEYAAFNAARSGSVWNMDKERMKRAAIISLLPTFRATPDWQSALTAATEAVAKDWVASQLGLPLIDVQVMSPKESDFGGKKEIEFDNSTYREQTKLTVRVSYLFEMKIPFANRIIFDQYWATHTGINLRGKNSTSTFRDDTKVLISNWKKGDFSKSCAYTGLDSNKMYKLRLAANLGFYYMPLVTTYTIRMQSNPFLHKPNKPAEKWAAPNSNSCS